MLELKYTSKNLPAELMLILLIYVETLILYMYEKIGDQVIELLMYIAELVVFTQGVSLGRLDFWEKMLLLPRIIGLSTHIHTYGQ